MKKPKNTKTYTQKQQQLAKMGKALAHPARIAILELLAVRNTCICGDITDELPLAQSTISQHLKELKKAGLIKGTIDGVKTCYCLDASGIRQMRVLSVPFIEKLIHQTQNSDC